MLNLEFLSVFKNENITQNPNINQPILAPCSFCHSNGRYPFEHRRLRSIQCAKIRYFLLFSATFSWRAIASQYYILMSGFAGHKNI